MKIEFIRNTQTAAGVMRVGAVAEVSEDEGRALVIAKRAVKTDKPLCVVGKDGKAIVAEAPAPAAKGKRGKVENSDPQPENRDPVIE